MAHSAKSATAANRQKGRNLNNDELQILIVDDEALARERLRRLLGQQADVCIVGEAAGGREALALIEQLQPDVLLLDINMPDLDGLRVIEALDDPPAIIFSTAHEHYAVRAFEKQAVDYLLKPYSAQRLAQALARARQWLNLGAADTTGPNDITPRAPATIAAEDGRETVLVPLEQVLALRIEVGVVFLLREDGERLVCMPTLQELEAQLPPELFFRASRQSLINLRQVRSYAPREDGSLRVKLGRALEETISRRRARHFRAFINPRIDTGRNS
jgi:DNA-binding LytR/AlgR family response regulator